MFWRKRDSALPEKKAPPAYPKRYCCLRISTKNRQILFVPFGITDIGIYAELDDIIVDTWPCDFGKLQTNIEATLDKFAPTTNYIKGRWPSYEASKAKSQTAYQADYISVSLDTDHTRPYGEEEVERITVNARPTALDTTYSLVGTSHLLGTSIAQIVVDIAEACDRIRG
jgi:hypothetical protein